MRSYVKCSEKNQVQKFKCLGHNLRRLGFSDALLAKPSIYAAAWDIIEYFRLLT